ncbi:methyl-accepting chemotaxis protein [Rhizomicrobium electricum]|uniref:Methyl-accepting chemotaxis protein n=1 Tax=Rhizomicrobium electricum TaxID=480070 RepID=A0ABP3P2P7_9PROT|nr:methyl-accepting chemotaxis protein [Rhizomicrobium electricum]NIJ47644.1 methyl-accepting chemotaxis protein [Rhizomicrobium electricum]
MGFRLADMPLLVKIAFAPTVALIALAGVAWVSINAQKNAAQDLRNVVDVEMVKSLEMKNIAQRIQDAHGQVYMLLTHQAGKIDTGKIDAQTKEVVASFASIEASLKALEPKMSADQKPMVVKLEKQVDETKSAVDLVGSMMSADFSAAVSFIDPFEKSYQGMLSTLDQVVKSTTDATNARAKASAEHSEATEQSISTIAIITLLLVGLLAALLVVMIRRDVKKIADATESLAGGNTNVDLEAMERGDEFGAIVKSLLVFRDNEARLVEARREQEETRKAVDTVVSSLASALTSLAAGDLTHRIKDEFKAGYSKVRDDYNAAMHKLEDTLRVIWQVMYNVQAGSAEISRASDDLSRRTEHQAATLEETAATIDNITATVKRTAEGALNARDAVSTAKEDATRTGAVVTDAVSAMHEIEKSAAQITAIIGVIDEIAFQTNLLALNAGIEAARAGDAGKGFAVVASEVRALSHRSADAAKQIKALIGTSTTKINQGVGLVVEAGKALDRIVTQVTEINDVVNAISASAQEESSSLAQVNTAVAELDGVTQGNAAMVEESTASSHSLAQETENLAALLGRFKVNGVDGQVVTSHAAKSKPVETPKAAAKPASKPAAKSAPKREKVAVNAGAAPATEAAATDDWVEF